MCETSSSIPVLVAKVAKISTKKHKGLVVVNVLLLTDSAPVLSLNDFKQIGIRNPGIMKQQATPNPIWARVSKAEILFCIAGSMENGRNWKSEWWNFSENHSVCPDVLWMNPPICVISPEAQASAAAYPDQKGLGHKDLVGINDEIHDWISFKMRIESSRTVRREDPGSFSRSQIRLSVGTCNVCKSPFVVTVWWRTAKSVLPNGIADWGGRETNCRLSERCVPNLGQSPASTEKWVAGTLYRSWYK